MFPSNLDIGTSCECIVPAGHMGIREPHNRTILKVEAILLQCVDPGLESSLLLLVRDCYIHLKVKNPFEQCLEAKLLSLPISVYMLSLACPSPPFSALLLQSHFLPFMSCNLIRCQCNTKYLQGGWSYSRFLIVVHVFGRRPY